MKRLIIGCGYLGDRVADRWLAAGDQVWVLTRSGARGQQLERQGFQVLVGDVTDANSLRKLPLVDTAVWSVGHDRGSGKSIHEVYVDGFVNLLAALDEGTRRVLYVSSTGVYGQQDGSWVDEESLCEPTRAGGQACLAAEQQLWSSSWSTRAVVLRLAGIYGPGRLPRLKELLAGEPLRCDPKGVINLIHVDDAAAVVTRVVDLPLVLPRTYLVADGQPVARGEFYQELALRTHVPPPSFQVGAGSVGSARRAGSHKRVSNERLINELGVQLLYPSYREGLAAVGRVEE